MNASAETERASHAGGELRERTQRITATRVHAMPKHDAMINGWLASATPRPTDRNPEASAFWKPRITRSKVQEPRAAAAEMPASERENQMRNEVRWFMMSKPPNVGVDAAARIHSSIAGPVMMRNTLPPLASNDLLGNAVNQGAVARIC
jgi:hypothetical protein